VSFESALNNLVADSNTAERVGRLAVVERAGRRGERTPLHSHPEDEVVHVMEGALVLVVGDQRIQLSAGETHSAPRATPHFLFVDSEKARYVSATFVRSAARYEEFLRAVAIPADGAEVSWDDGDAFRLAALAAPNGIEIIDGPHTVEAD
jgi:quercetin dioxygenase-like cupin family protein